MDDDDYIPASDKKKSRPAKPNYADFKETRNDKMQLQCECGSQTWHLWGDNVTSCASCGLPESSITFDLLPDDEAGDRQRELMA